MKFFFVIVTNMTDERNISLSDDIRAELICIRAHCA